MADNSLRTPGSGETIASDDVGGVKFQRVKLTTGADGTAVDTLNPADAMVAANSGILPSTIQTFNETTYDRMRGNTPTTTLLASAARTTSTLSPAQTNYNGRGVFIYLVVTVAGTGNLTLFLQELTSNGIVAGFAAVTTTGNYQYLAYPGCSAATPAAQSVAVPRAWYANVTKSDASSWTYSLVGCVIV